MRGAGQTGPERLESTEDVLIPEHQWYLWVRGTCDLQTALRVKSNQVGERKSWGFHTTAILQLLPVTKTLLLKNKPSHTLCWSSWIREESCNSMLTIQEQNHFTGSDTDQQPGSRLGCHVRTIWRKWLSLWLKRKYTSNAFAHHSLTNPEEPDYKSVSGIWRFLSVRHLLLLSGSGHRHLVASDHLHICHCAVESTQPCFMSSPLMNRCFLDDGELVILPHEVIERHFSEDRISPELFASDTSQRDKATGFSNKFSSFYRHAAPQMRLRFGAQSDTDLEELLAEDEVDGGGEWAGTNWARQ